MTATTTSSNEMPYPRPLAGIPMLIFGIALGLGAIWMLVQGAVAAEAGVAWDDLPVWSFFVAMGACTLASVFVLRGLVLVNPNYARVVLLFGKYKGSIRTAGMFWINPFTIRRPISRRAHNFNSEKLKVNDKNGNPIEIGAVVVWRVLDTAKAQFDVEDHESYVEVQTESALRALASGHPYDADDAKPGETSLRGSADIVNRELQTELTDRLAMAGIEVHECRLAHLAYAPEIANAMLQRQQADAIIAARTRIVDGAVGMVKMALDDLRAQGVVELDEDKKAAMVSNLLVVLCSERGTTPVVNTGTLYQG